MIAGIDNRAGCCIEPIRIGCLQNSTGCIGTDSNTCGSGSFLVSAVLEGRKYIGIEKNEQVYLHKKHAINYLEVCNKRIKEATIQYKKSKTLFD